MAPAKRAPSSLPSHGDNSRLPAMAPIDGAKSRDLHFVGIG
jgi:hypothetical protein